MVYHAMSLFLACSQSNNYLLFHISKIVEQLLLLAERYLKTVFLSFLFFYDELYDKMISITTTVLLYIIQTLFKYHLTNKIM